MKYPLSAVFNQQYDSTTIQKASSSNYNMISIMRGRYHMQHHFRCQQDEWSTKEDIGKSMKNALYVLWCAGAKRDEVTSNSEKMKPVAIAVIKLHLFEGISQSVTRKIC